MIVGVDKGTYTVNQGTRQFTVSGLDFTPTIEGILVILNITQRKILYAAAQSHSKTVTITPSGDDFIFEYSSIHPILADDDLHIQLSDPTNIDVNTHPSDDFISCVTRGKLTGYSAIDKFGQNTDVDAGSEDLWSGGGTWVAPTQSRIHNIASTSPNDDGDPVGTGARTIKITGISGGVRVSETKALNGTTVVPTTNSYTMIDRMEVLTVGTTGSNVGTITATAVTDGTVTARIEATQNQTRSAIFQIPTVAQATLDSWYFNIGGVSPATTIVTIQIQEKKNIANSPWVTKHIEVYNSDTFPGIQHHTGHYKKFEAGSYIKMRVTADKDNTSVSGGFNILIVND